MRQRTVLLIAANPQEGQRTRCSLAQAGLHPVFQVVSDGEEALAYLRREGVYTELHQAPPPDVVVLDLPLPLELVQCLKQEILVGDCRVPIRRLIDSVWLWSAPPLGPCTLHGQV